MKDRIPLIIVLSAFAFAVWTLFAAPAHNGTSLPAAFAQDTPPALPTPPQATRADSPAADADLPEGADVQVRGPVHEAFASPVDANPQASPVVPKKPPEPIEEVAPDEQPEGENVIWIPGYWAWDDEREDYLWISGLWRNAPPGQAWVPGYWTTVDGGYQWTPGFWTSAAKDEVSYIQQAPPDSLDTGPSSPAPSDQHFWIQGCWNYQETRYVWRPGYWAAYQPNWMWIPAHYAWCPGGYVFIDGYWDYLPQRRGCLFAPVYFSNPIYLQPAFVYRPAVVFNVGYFGSNLFVRPGWCHYYVGDYYATSYVGLGFHPWFEINIGGHRRCDPFFTYYNCRNGQRDRNWVAHERDRFDDLRDNKDHRPPHSFKDQSEWLAKHGGDKNGAPIVAAAPIKQAINKPDEIGGVKLKPVSQEKHRESATVANDFKRFTRDREDQEKKIKITGIAADKTDDTKTARTAVTAPGLKLPTEITSKVKNKGVAVDTRSRTTGGANLANGNVNKKSDNADWPRTKFDVNSPRQPFTSGKDDDDKKSTPRKLNLTDDQQRNAGRMKTNAELFGDETGRKPDNTKKTERSTDDIGTGPVFKDPNDKGNNQRTVKTDDQPRKKVKTDDDTPQGPINLGKTQQNNPTKSTLDPRNQFQGNQNNRVYRNLNDNDRPGGDVFKARKSSGDDDGPDLPKINRTTKDPVTKSPTLDTNRMRTYSGPSNQNFNMGDQLKKSPGSYVPRSTIQRDAQPQRTKSSNNDSDDSRSRRKKDKDNN